MGNLGRTPWRVRLRSVLSHLAVRTAPNPCRRCSWHSDVPLPWPSGHARAWSVFLATQVIRKAMSVRRALVPWQLVAIELIAAAVCVTLTIVVTGGSSLALDSRAFELAGDLRAPWLDDLARVVTKLGLIAVVGSAVLVGVAVLIKHRNRVRAAVLVVGATLTWISVWLVKSLVDRPRPSDPLVHTSGKSYPSAHAANSVGWLALAVGLTVVIRTRGGRIAAITGGAVAAVLVGLSRIYLRAHYASDVLGGEALAVGCYVLAAIGAIVWQSRRDSAIREQANASSPTGIT